ncbi:S-layer homology domain-containing protein, partial [Paenibacillus camerounensis]|uniref:S-layer homology domain-containing protein n=1 Tax=Paenibacillus camerounensis TaxID=1243663 RepID=UPI0006937724
GAGQIPTGTVLIKNKWKSNYLYETGEGIIRYGMTNPADTSAHWRVETTDDLSRIKNVKTGHYITLAGNAGKEDSLKAAASTGGGNVSEQWLIDLSNRSGYMVIRSATAPEGKLVIHQENQLGYAQVSADINVTFESPQWAFVDLSAAPAVRLESRMRPGQVMYEEEGKVRYGRAALGNEAAQWFLEPGEAGGTLTIRNRATGHYIKQNTEHWSGVAAEAIDPADKGLSEWIQEAALGDDGAGYITLRNYGLTDGGKELWLNPQYGDDNDVRSNNWPGWAGNHSAQWTIVPVTELQPVRIAAYTDEQTAADYLYEASGGALAHGAIVPEAANENSYLWYIEDYDGHKRLRNAASGHYITYTEGSVKALALSGSQPSDRWVFNESDDYDDYQTIGNVQSPGVYLAMLAGGGAGAGTDASTLATQWQLLDPSTPTDNAEHYYRIQNGWQSFYWYESKEGQLKYGNMQEDGSDQWLVEKYNGRKLFKNRKTGHYINIAQMPDGHIQVSPLADKANVDQTYMWTGKNTGDSTYVISSVLDKEPGKRPEKYISLQNLTKYAEYGVINPDWGSPKWRFVPVTEKKQELFRFKLNSVNGEDQYLQDGPVPAVQENERKLEEGGASVTEDVYAHQSGPEVKNTGSDEKSTLTAETGDESAGRATQLEHAEEQAAESHYGADVAKAADDSDMTVGQATYGTLDLEDDSFVWQLQEIPGTNGAVKIKNRGTGRYLSLQNFGEAIEQELPELAVPTEQTVYDVWASIRWVVDMQQSGVSTIKSAWAGHYLYGAAGADGEPVIRISKAAGASSMDSARFTAEAVTEAPPAVPVYPLRFKNAQTGDYLYENEYGVVLYGQPAADNGYSHWTISGGADGQFIVNRATGHYLTLNEDYSFLEGSAEPDKHGASAWRISLAADYRNYLIRSLYGEYDDELIHVSNKTGYAERTLLLDSEVSAQWALEAAPGEFNRPAGEARNSDTSTPVQDNTNIVRIAPQSPAGKVLAEKNGQPVYADSTDFSAKAEWLVQDYNGRKRIKNVQTGHYLSLDEKGTAVLGSGGGEASQWITEEKLGFMRISSAGHSAVFAVDGNEQWSFVPVPKDIVYPGKDAFHGNGLLRFAVNAEQAGEYSAVLRYKYPASTGAALNVTVNGLPQGIAALTAGSGNWNEVPVELALRAGMNTVTISSGDGDWSKVSVDSLTVKDSVAKAYRGATVPYIGYEAEDAVTNGELIGPSRKYRSVASEASGRQAVVLKDTGDYIEFTLAEAANAIVLRYSIPDSPDGAGAEETLTLVVNGQRQELSLTSKYAWEYGSYPWSNDPRQGSGHRFFDEIHALIGEAPAGAVIRLEKSAQDQAASYVIDLAELEQVAPALEMPAGYLSVTDYGAVPDDEGDDTAGFKAALAAAEAAGSGVWFPAGSFNVGDGLLDLYRADIRGAGMWHTTLNGAKFYGHGGEISVHDLLIEGGINVRDDEAVTNAFHGAFGQGSLIQNVWIEHTKAGLWLTQPGGEKARTDGLHMVGLRIRNLMADGINFAVGTGNSMMEQSDIRYPGDDGIAMWSFTDDKLKDVNGSERTPSFNNTARFNTVALPWLADNIVVFGGRDNKIQDNIVKDTVTNGAGIAVSTRFSAEPFHGTTVVERNTLLRTGSYDSGYGVNLGAIWLYAGESNLNADIQIGGNTILDSTFSGLVAHGNMRLDGVVLTDNVIDGAGTSGVEVTPDLTGSLLIDNLIIRGERMNLLANPAAGFTIREKNQGIAAAVKPFTVKLADGQKGPFTLKQGTAAELQVLDQNGADLTAQAEWSFTEAGIAGLKDGRLQAVAAGNTLLSVSVNGSSRVYDLAVLKPDDTESGSPGGTGGSGGSAGTGAAAADGDARLSAAAAAGQREITIAAGAGGTARFSAAALRSAAAAVPGAVLVVTSGTAAYRFPLHRAERVLEAAGLADGTLEFALAPLGGAALEKLLADAGKQALAVKGVPAGFTLSVLGGSGAAAVPVSGFGAAYAERTLTVGEAVSADRAAALLYDAQTGTFRYVPALFETAGGVTKVTVKSNVAGGVIAVALHPVSFSDLSGHWAKTEIELLAGKLILNGTGAGNFAPQQTVSRAEFAAMLVRSLGLLPDAAADAAAFSDVPAGAWFAADAQAAAGLGLVQGYADGTFRPEAPVTREQLAVMAARALKLMQSASALPEAVHASAAAEPGATTAANVATVTTQPGLTTAANVASVAAKTRATTAANVATVAAKPGATIAANVATVTTELEGAVSGTAPTSNASALASQAFVTGAASGAAPVTPGSFSDAADIASWAQEAVNTLTAGGIMLGRPSGSFAPQAFTSRAEAAVILARLLRAGRLLND